MAAATNRSTSARASTASEGTSCGTTKPTPTRRGLCRGEQWKDFLWNDEADAYTPWLVSWEQWKDYLRNHTGRIVDEYGGRHDVEDFIGRVEAVPMEARRRQFDWVLTHRRGQASETPSPSGDWLDADGLSFYGGEFS